MHRAGAAQRRAAAELGAGEAELFTHHPQQRRVGIKVQRHALAIEDEKTGVKVLQTQLPASALRFAPPQGILKPGTQYKASIGAIGPSGNASYAETTFTTAKP